MSFSFTFSLTPEEVMDAYERPRHALMRWDWIGNCAVTLWGAGMTTVCAISLLAGTPSLPLWKVVFGLVLGVSAVSYFGIAPLIGALRARHATAGPITVTVDHQGLRAAYGADAAVAHPWTQLKQVHTVGGGVLLDFAGGAYMVPRRAFASVHERRTFAAELQRMLHSPRQSS